MVLTTARDCKVLALFKGRLALVETGDERKSQDTDAWSLPLLLFLLQGRLTVDGIDNKKERQDTDTPPLWFIYLFTILFLLQGRLTVDGMDDKKEMQDTDAAFDILGFTQEEKLDLFKGTGSICYLGNTAFGQRGKKNHRKMPALTRPRRMKLTKSKHENDPDDTRMMGRCE